MYRFQGFLVGIVLAIAAITWAAAPVPPPPELCGADGAGGAWMTVGSDDAMLAISNAGAISLIGCLKPKIQTVGAVTVVDCGPVFGQKLAAAVLAELHRSKP